MPTAGKLFAALGFALVGFLAAEAFKPQMPGHTVFGVFSLVCAALGAVVGWVVSGRRAGRGWAVAAGVGVTASAVLTALALFAFSFREMILRSLNRRYDDPFEAVVSVFEIALEHATRLVDPAVLGILVFGGVLAGLVAELAARRWR